MATVWCWSWLLTIAQASTLWVQAPQSSSLDYKATLKAHSNAISPTQDYLNRHPKSENRERLLQLLATAQQDFLVKSNSEARARFVELVRLLNDDDWSKADRDVFLQAYLRLAQLADTSAERESWLIQSLILTDASFDTSLYPPPLLQRRAELIAHVPRKTLARPTGWTLLLIDGQPCSRDTCTDIPVGVKPFRVTYLSDQWLPQSKILDLAETARPPLVAIPWITGKCAQFQWNSAAEHYPKKAAFWSLDCDRPQSIAQNLAPLPAQPPEALAGLVTTETTRRPFYKSTWFWAGVGVVAAASVAILVMQHQPKEVHQPTTTYSY